MNRASRAGKSTCGCLATPRRVVPPIAGSWKQAWDMKKKDGAHGAVRAWRADDFPFTSTMAYTESHARPTAPNEGVELAIRSRCVIRARMAAGQDRSYTRLPRQACRDMADARLIALAGRARSGSMPANEENRLGIYPARGHGKSTAAASEPCTKYAPQARSQARVDGWL